MKKRYNLEYPKVTDLYTDIDKLKNDLHEISVSKDTLKEKYDILNENYELQNKKLTNSTELCEQLSNEVNLQKTISSSLENELTLIKTENINYKNKVEELQVLLEEKMEELSIKSQLQISKNINLEKSKDNEDVPNTSKPRVRLYGSRRRKV
jgi:chromosome segregation ATPase